MTSVTVAQLILVLIFLVSVLALAPAPAPFLMTVATAETFTTIPAGADLDRPARETPNYYEIASDVDVDLDMDVDPEFVNQEIETTVMLGTSFTIPCNFPSYKNIFKIVWKDAARGNTLMSYDVNEAEPLVIFKEDVKNRVFFPWPSLSKLNNKLPPFVLIHDLKVTDSGLYQCLVIYYSDFIAQGVIVRLQVRAPERPTRMVIKDSSGETSSQDNLVQKWEVTERSELSKWGHYTEGQNLSLTCSSLDGYPLPTVIWRENGQLIDNTTNDVDRYTVTNELTIVHLDRHHLSSVFTCEVSNSEEMEPLLSHLKIDVYLPPKRVQLNIPHEMKVGGIYHLSCMTAGAYPSVRIHIFVGLKDRWPKLIKSAINPDEESSYYIVFIPEASDDDSVVACIVDNPLVNGIHSIEQRKKIRVLSLSSANATSYDDTSTERPGLNEIPDAILQNYGTDSTLESTNRVPVLVPESQKPQVETNNKKITAKPSSDAKQFGAKAAVIIVVTIGMVGSVGILMVEVFFILRRKCSRRCQGQDGPKSSEYSRKLGQQECGEDSSTYYSTATSYLSGTSSQTTGTGTGTRMKWIDMASRPLPPLPSTHEYDYVSNYCLRTEL